MNRVIDWLRSIGCFVLLEGGTGYSMVDGAVINARTLLDRANRLRAERGLKLFPPELAATRGIRRQMAQTGNVHLLIQG